MAMEIRSGMRCSSENEKRGDSNGEEDEGRRQEFVLNKGNKLELARAEMGKAREENHRLKAFLQKLTEDYQVLHEKYRCAIQQVANKQASNGATRNGVEDSELVSLSLGRTSSSDLKKDERCKDAPRKGEVTEGDARDGLELGLDCKFEASSTTHLESSANLSQDNSDGTKEDIEETSGKVTKHGRSGDEEASLQNPQKKTRVSVRVRCDTPTMNDGCQWRKYGQKIAKGNPCPRAYYRCTVAPSCPVRKQVQRCAQDMSILITTYEGTHNHPLSISATAMASTTSAAASMLMSGSSVSNPNPSTSTATSPAVDLHGQNYFFSGIQSKQFYMPTSSITSSPSCPTITLDLTSNTVSSSSPLNRLPNNFAPRYSATNLNFSALESNALPASWSNGVLSYGTGQVYSNKNQIGSLNFVGRQPQESLYQSYVQKNAATLNQPSPIPETIEAATKAITSDPNFQSALQAALTSIISCGSGGGVRSQNEGDKFQQSTNLPEIFPVLSSFPSVSSTIKCASSYLNKPTATTNSQPANVLLPHNPSPFPNSKSKPASPDRGGDRGI